jgi:hypothetical protein
LFCEKIEEFQAQIWYVFIIGPIYFVSCVHEIIIYIPNLLTLIFYRCTWAGFVLDLAKTKTQTT